MPKVVENGKKKNAEKGQKKKCPNEPKITQNDQKEQFPPTMAKKGRFGPKSQKEHKMAIFA